MQSIIKYRVLIAILLMVALCFTVSCAEKPQVSGAASQPPADAISSLDSFEGSISVGCCVAAAGDFEKQLIESFVKLCEEKNYYILTEAAEDRLKCAQDFVDGGMDFVVCFGYSEADDVPSVCEEKGTYAIGFGTSVGEGSYCYSPAGDDPEKAAELLLKYIYGVMILGEDCPASYSPVL